MYHGERLNAWTHLIGAVAACTGAVWLTVQASLNGSPWKIVGVGVYGVTLTLLYSISTAYHSVRGRAKVVMRKLDHLSIYLLIAGSYTPFCLVTLRGPGAGRCSASSGAWPCSACSRRSSHARGAGAVGGDLRGDGLDRADRGETAARRPRQRRLHLAGGRRRALYRRDRLLCL